jgi:hypothetical protein
VTKPVPNEHVLLGEASLRLSTPGRRTGRPHEVLVWFAYRDRRFHFLAHRRDHGLGTDWYRNLVAAGEVTARVGGRTYQMRHEQFPQGADSLILVLEIFEAKYGAKAVAEWYRPTQRIAVRARLIDDEEPESGPDDRR